MNKLRIFIISSDQQEIQQLTTKLGEENFQLFVITQWNTAVDKIRRSQPDLVILDSTLSDFDGLEICKMIRKNIFTAYLPIILLSTKSDNPQDIITAYEIGADDYIKKPFNVDVLLARIKAVLRRIKPKDEKEDIVQCKGITVNYTRHITLLDNRQIDLTPKEFDLLYILIKKKGKLLTRESLCENVWGYEYFGTTRTVDFHIRQLRQKLGKYANRIKTVETLGYLFE